MVFSSGVFLFIFLPITIVGNWLLRNKSTVIKNAFLLLMSAIFYLESGIMQFMLLVLSIAINYLFARLIANAHDIGRYKQKRIILILAIIYNIGVLFIFKYLSFVLGEITALFGGTLPSKIANIVLPLGISFYTFQALSYVIDVYRDKSMHEKNIINVALYISFFPQLVAGPIVRWGNVKHDLTICVREGDWNEGFRRFALGLGKKMIIANQMALFADKAFNLLKEGSLTTAFAWLGAITYSLQIYYDFSGYSDMAIGLGKMFGFHFPENFNYPYVSKSITEFWRRWHISLSLWFRDYVYIPLGGNRCTTVRMLFNLFIVWMLTGIWHGSNYTFWLWGVLYFVFLLLEKEFTKATSCWLKADERNKRDIIGNFFGHIYTMFIVILLWVIFRAENVTDAANYVIHMFGKSVHTDYAVGVTELYFRNFWGYGLLAVIGCFPMSQAFTKRMENGLGLEIYKVLSDIGTVVVFVLACCFAIDSNYNPFIYSNF